MIHVQPVYYPLYNNKDKFITLITGGRGSAKSFNASTFVERLSFEEGHIILFCRYTMSSASISVIPEFKEKIELEGTQDFFSIRKNDIENKMSDSLVMFRGIRTSSGNQTANLKSIQGLTTFVCDEAEEWESEADFDKLVLSIRQKGIQNRIIIIMNPTDVNHFVYRKYIKDTHKLVDYDGVKVQISTHPNVLHIHTTYLDKIDNLPQQFLDEVADILTKDPKKEKKYAHTVIGRWADIAEGAIFKNWELVEEIPEFVKRRGIGLDFGYTIDPSASLECAVFENDLYLDEIFYKTHMKSGNIIDSLTPYNLKVISESADPRLIDDIALGGISIYPVDKSGESIKAGIQKMQEFNLKVTKRSYNLLYELRNYVWAKDKEGNYINMPATGQQDHLIDAARYWVLGEILGKIKGFSDFETVESTDKGELGSHIVLVVPEIDNYFIAVSSYRFGDKILISDVIFNKNGVENQNHLLSLLKQNSVCIYESSKEWFKFGGYIRSESGIANMRLNLLKNNNFQFIKSRSGRIKESIVFRSNTDIEYNLFKEMISSYSEGNDIGPIYTLAKLVELHK